MKNKLFIKEKVYTLESQKEIQFKEIKFSILPDDVVITGYEEPYFSEDNSYDGYYYFHIYRNRLETDEEYNKRINGIEQFKIEEKNRRYQNYLKLKKEFENT